MSIDEFISALQKASNIEFSVVLRRPEEYDILQKENDVLRLENQALKARLDTFGGVMSENIALRSRLKSAKKVLNANGISSAFLDR